jgi:hypothetical protein
VNERSRLLVQLTVASVVIMGLVLVFLLLLGGVI